MSEKEKSRIPNFYKLSVPERVKAVHEKGWLTAEDVDALTSGSHTLSLQNADRMIENVIGVLGLPVGLGLNFLINGKEYVVPLAVEEPSIVAALSSAAKVARDGGGFTAECTDPILIGQVQIMNTPHPAQARARLLQRRDQILNLANALHPKMVARGGGARDIEVFIHPTRDMGDMLVLHLLVDTRDAMGANLVNTMCEGIASLVEKITGGKVFLRILSNLTDRAMVKAETTIPLEDLRGRRGFDAEQVRDGIIIASEFAEIDPYRAATHNKGVMNGIDAVAIATGNDWRAIEAGAHAYAARGGRYTALTQWRKNDNGDLVGRIQIPLKVGIVGGPLQSNPTVALNLRIMGVDSAPELAAVMGAVGLAQNFSALRALATEGIQKGHMTLHARSVATAAGASPEIFDSVVERLVESGEIKIWKAREIVATVKQQSHAEEDNVDSAAEQSSLAAGHGKAILMGEHAVVYGSHAIAAPIPLAVEAKVGDWDDGIRLAIPRWGVDHRLETDPEHRRSFEKPAARILEKLELIDQPMNIEVFPNLPRAQGLGGSAAVAVAIVRALDRHFRLGLSEAETNDLAFEGERIAHGNPSGIDNAVATYGQMLLFRRGDPPLVEQLELPKPISMVIGMTGVESLTAKMVARVRSGWEQSRRIYDRIFNEIDQLTLRALEALRAYELERVGQLMNVGQGLLNALQVSSWEIEELVQIARDNGALGAKLTGAGGGGSIIALCPEDPAKVAKAIEEAGYQAMEVKIG
ncbi:MAG: hydroxymethylglutaryl-CoA reductase, degradative [Xanthomonadales bacterium]|nr:hydroxymethylglutaryl-CoA reductase, degradative [Xanthomonadales bacterium]